MEANATPVMGPEVSSDPMMLKNGFKYINASMLLVSSTHISN